MLWTEASFKPPSLERPLRRRLCALVRETLLAEKDCAAGAQASLTSSSSFDFAKDETETAEEFQQGLLPAGPLAVSPLLKVRASVFNPRVVGRR